MKFFIVFLAVFLAVAQAQFQQFGFQPPSGFSSGGFGFNAAQRDPRANTGSPQFQMPNGPVLFPPAPADSGMTSGVVVGASGYGFVPPNQPSAKAQALPFF